MKSLAILLLILPTLVLATHTTTATTEPSVPKYIGRDGNITCIILEALIKIRIPYPLTNGSSSTATIQVANDALTRGHCMESSQSQTIDIYFVSQSNKLSFNFTRADAICDRDTAYKLDTVSIQFTSTESLFPGTTWTSGTSFKASTSSSSFPRVAADQGYYLCDNAVDFDITSIATAELNSLRFKSFVRDNKQEFRGKAAVCGIRANLVILVISVIIIAVVLGTAAIGVVGCLKKNKHRTGYISIN